MLDAETLSAARAQIELLREENTQLKEALGALASTDFYARCRKVFGLSAGPAGVLHALLKGRAMPREHLVLAVANRRTDDPANPAVVNVYIHQLRQALKPHGIRIETVHGVGYQLSGHSLAALKVALEARL